MRHAVADRKSQAFEVWLFHAIHFHHAPSLNEDKAYVDSQTSEEIADQKGTPKEPGKNSPFRNRTIEENTTLFKQMKEGKVEPGKHVLRAKIDMSSPNMLMRDPVIYRVLNASHCFKGYQ